MHEAAGGSGGHDGNNDPGANVAKSPSDFSCHSYELFVGQEKGNDDNNKERISIKSEALDSGGMCKSVAPSGTAATFANKIRKVSVVS